MRQDRTRKVLVAIAKSCQTPHRLSRTCGRRQGRKSARVTSPSAETPRCAQLLAANHLTKTARLRQCHSGLIFGSGMFGATGSGCMVSDNQAITGEFSPFWWGEYTTNKWGWNSMSFLPQYADRFVVDGMVVPEPSTFTLLAAGALGLVGYGWRWRRASKSAKPTSFDQDTPAILAFPSHSSQAHAARKAA